MKKSRINVLDGFRAIAIMSVLLYHYFSRWTPPLYPISLYPYNNEYDYFKYGYLGVHFFFIISGFVIFYTLDNTSNIVGFWEKRLIRLFPSMFIASVIIYLFFNLFDRNSLFPDSHLFKNFLPSLTFTAPFLFNKLTHNKYNFNFLNGSFWSLWVEIQFYFFASVLFYIRKEVFLINYLITALIITFIHYLLFAIENSYIPSLPIPTKIINMHTYWVFNIFSLPLHLCYFSFGIIFYQLYKNKQNNVGKNVFLNVALGIFLLFNLYFCDDKFIMIVIILMIVAFYLFIYYHNFLAFLDTRIINAVGVSSYFIYLIHENIGVFIINKLGAYFMPYGFVLPLLIIVCIICISVFYTYKIDKRISNKLKNLIVRKDSSNIVKI